MMLLQIKLLIAKFLCSSAIGRIIGFLSNNLVRSRGLIINTANVTNNTKAMLFWGLYESAEARFIEQSLRSDLPVVELGSSIGYISCLIRRKLGLDQRLICVEANSGLVEIISSNLKINNLLHRVSVLNVAIDYDSSEVEFQVGSSNVDGRIGSQKLKRNDSVLVRAITLKLLLQECSVEDEYVLVCDIEGAENAIIKRDAVALAKCRQIIIELHDSMDNDKFVHWQHLIAGFLQIGFVMKKQYGPVCVFEK